MFENILQARNSKPVNGRGLVLALAITTLAVAAQAADATAPPRNHLIAATPPRGAVVAPVGRNGDLLIQASANRALFLLAPGAAVPRRFGGFAATEGRGAWSPDGLRVAFGTAGGVLAVDLETRRLRRVADRGADPAWSPDGSRIAYSIGEWIYVKTLGGRARRFARGGEPSWSPDGKWLAYTRDFGILMTSLTGNTRQLAYTGADGCPDRYSSPDWSPSGSAIAITITEGACEPLRYTMIGLVTPWARWGDALFLTGPLTGGPDNPVWSPDGKVLAYDESYGDGSARLALYRPHKGVSTRLSGKWSVLDWQPVCSVRGGPRADRLRARRSGDLVCGLAGSDRIAGGAAQDRLFGEAGDDRFFARDGKFDVIGCGAGVDSVVADRHDLVGRDCERVTRR